MLSMAAAVRQATGLDADERYYGGRSQPRVWTPDSFGVARMAAYAWLLKFEEDARTAAANGQESAGGSFVDPLGERAAKPDADRDTVYDWMYVEQVRSNFNTVFQFSKRLARDGGVEEQQFYLNSLRLRGVEATEANIDRGTYPLVRPFLFVTSAAPPARALDFVRWIVGPEGREVTRSEGLLAR